MKTIARFQTPEEAHLFRLFLEARDISAHVWDENLVQAAWHYSDAIGGVRIVVNENDSSQALLAYSEYTHSLNVDSRPITVARAWPLILMFSLLTGAPALIFGRRTVKDTSCLTAHVN